MTTTINAATSGGLISTADTSGILALQTAGTTAVTVTASQNVGIGTASPGAKLEVTGAIRSLRSGSTAAVLQVINDNNSWNITSGTSTAQFRIDNNLLGTALTIDSSNNVGIGTTATTTYRATIANNGGNQLRLYATDVASSTTNTIDFWYLDGGGSPYNNTSIRSLSTANAGNGNLAFYTTPTSGSLTERMRIDSNGWLYLNTTSRNDFGFFNLNYDSTLGIGIGLKQTNSGGGTMMSFLNSSGGFYGSITNNGTSTAFNTSSDYRLKENIAPISGALTKVSALKPCTYTWKVDGSDGQGFIAHELQEIFPDAVHGEKDAINEDGSIKAQGIDTSFLVATLTAAIQELNAKVDAQAAEIQALKGAK